MKSSPRKRPHRRDDAFLLGHLREHVAFREQVPYAALQMQRVVLRGLPLKMRDRLRAIVGLRHDDPPRFVDLRRAEQASHADGAGTVQKGIDGEFGSEGCGIDSLHGGLLDAFL